MRKITIKKEKLYFEDEIIGLFEKTVTKFGSGAKIDAPKDILGKKVYVLVRKDRKSVV
jgi:putative transposon-encoded protein